MAIHRLDDYFYHQTDRSLLEVASTDHRFFDCFYFVVHSPDGEVVQAMRLAAYPNNRVMDGQVLAAHEGKQYNFRPSRALNGDRDQMDVGPYHVRIEEPWKSWRLWLEPNDYDLEFDLRFEGRYAPLDCGRVDRGRAWHQSHYVQSGRYNGYLRVGDSRWDVRDWLGHRDRSWGVRGAMPGARPDPADGIGGIHLWMPAQFSDRCIFVWLFEDPDGTVTKLEGGVMRDGQEEVIPFVRVDHEIQFEPGTRRLQRGRLACVDARGNKEILEVESVSCLYLGGAGEYTFPPRGHYYGDLHLEGEVWDFSRPEVKAAFAGANGDQFVRFRHEGEVGYGVFELFVVASERYGFAPIQHR